jgi:hypothetical protein
MMDDQRHFSGCPVCGGDDGILTVNRSHWMVCNAHGLRWWVGANLFSYCEHQTEEERRAEAEALATFKDTDPARTEEMHGRMADVLGLLGRPAG